MTAILALSLPVPVAGQGGSLFEVDAENLGRGYDPTKAFDVGDIDAVNTFNGSLNVTLPMGRSSTTGGGFSYGLNLTYNSNVWDTTWLTPAEGPALFNQWEIDNCEVWEKPQYWPVLTANAGFGWRLSPFGEIYGPNSLHKSVRQVNAEHDQNQLWLYVGPDGGRHKFYGGQLHQPNHLPAAVRYTSDSTYLRLSDMADPSDGTPRKVLEFPDGRVMVWELEDPEVNSWRVIRVMDQKAARFFKTLGYEATEGNYVAVSYDFPSANTKRMTLADSAGREQQIIFKRAPQVDQYEWLLDEVRQPALDGATATTVSHYFRYEWKTIRRPLPHVPWAQELGNIEVPQLADVCSMETLASDSPETNPCTDSSGVLNRYEMTYTTSAHGTDREGLLHYLTLPTGGNLGWSYGFYGFPNRFKCELVMDEGDCDTGQTEEHSSAGVIRRTFHDVGKAVTGPATAVWRYRQDQIDADESGMVFIDERVGVLDDQCTEIEQVGTRTTVTDPEGFKTEYYYTTFMSRLGSSVGDQYRRGDYGLPFSRHDEIDLGVAGSLALSTRRLSNDAQSTLLRSTYANYLSGSKHAKDADTNRRQIASRTIYHDDGDRYVEEQLSNFDGLGNHRLSVSGDTFEAGGFGRIRASFTNFNPAANAYNVDPVTGSVSGGFAMPATSAPWVLGTFTDSWTQKGGSDGICSQNVAKTEALFDADGKLTRHRVRKACGRGANDVLTVFEYGDSAGNVTSTKSYGGDYQDIGTSNLAATDLSSLTAEYRRDAAYSFGTLSALEWVSDCDDTTYLPLKSATVDPGTGAYLEISDVRGLATGFEYDVSGRVAKIAPEVVAGQATQEALTVYDYALSENGSPATARVTRQPNPDGGPVLAESEYEFDGLGRVHRDKQKMPGNVWGIVQTDFNGLGWVTRQSERALVPGNWTVSSSFDAFGRAGLVTRPDNTKTRSAYEGIREQTLTIEGIASSYPGAMIDAVTVRLSDRRGNVVQVEEPTGGVAANYSYDVGDRLERVTLNPGPAAQVRTFTYDRRGFLSAENHPEVIGPISYKYDSQGNVRERKLGTRLFYHYDNAARLVVIEDDAGNRWKEYSFVPGLAALGDPFLAGRWGAGQLFQATRHNWIGASDKVVTETYAYDGLQGRVSRRTTRVDVPDVEFTYSLSYDQLGNVNRQNYPRCSRGCGGQVDTFPRSVNFEHTKGLLTEVVGFTSSTDNIAYHPNGLISRVTHFNGVVDRVALDSSGMQRPGAMWAAKDKARPWDSGPYRYDAAGNVWRIGKGGQKNEFRYDAVGRLTGGRLKVNGQQREQRYSYDSFGNIESIVTDGVTRTIPIQTARNRLSEVPYDSEGNQKAHGTAQLKYDRLNMVSALTGASNNWRYLYTAADERLLSIERVRKRRNVWRLRGLDNRVLTEYQNRVRGDERHWSPPKDWIYRGQTPLATVRAVAGPTPDEVRHIHVDHAGSTRLITDGDGAAVESYEYFPFGALATGGDAETMLFTGHERDLLNEPGVDNDLDYMHARYYSPVLGRFTKPDPVLGRVSSPQSWNRYVYSVNSPVSFLDESGRFAKSVHAYATEHTLRSFGVSDEAIRIVVAANLAQDRNPVNRVNVSRHATSVFRSDSFATRRGRRTYARLLSRAVQQAEAGDLAQSLETVGAASHTLGDLIAHGPHGNVVVNLFSRLEEHHERDNPITVRPDGQSAEIRDQEVHDLHLALLRELWQEYLSSISEEQRRQLSGEEGFERLRRSD